jgi:murein DD-endopeptidase MepM/ murein hydrolase activator NlpD
VRPRPVPRCVAAFVLVGAALLVGAVFVALAPPARAAGGPWQWPLEPAPDVLTGFVAPTGSYGPGHRGADLAADVGQPVVAAGPGVVAFAGRVAGRGVVSVAHHDGRRTTYEPVAATLSAGEAVGAGDVLGVVTAGPGHCLPATCLHWGLRAGDDYLDPLSLLGRTEVRLLPVWAPGAAWTPGAILPPTPVGQPGGTPDRGPLLAGSRGG